MMVPNSDIARVSYTSNRPQHDSGRYLGSCTRPMCSLRVSLAREFMPRLLPADKQLLHLVAKAQWGAESCECSQLAGPGVVTNGVAQPKVSRCFLLRTSVPRPMADMAE